MGLVGLQGSCSASVLVLVVPDGSYCGYINFIKAFGWTAYVFSALYTFFQVIKFRENL
jgi:hypothetical protein